MCGTGSRQPSPTLLYSGLETRTRNVAFGQRCPPIRGGLRDFAGSQWQLRCQRTLAQGPGVRSIVWAVASSSWPALAYPFVLASFDWEVLHAGNGLRQSFLVLIGYSRSLDYPVGWVGPRISRTTALCVCCRQVSLMWSKGASLSK